jgi:hypothetical protein
VSRGIKALATVAVVVVAVVLGLRALRSDDDRTPAAGDPSSTGSGSGSERSGPPPAYPDDMPAEGMYVDSTVTADGQVEVETWIRSATPLSELTVTTTDPDLAPGGVESLDVHVRTMAGRNLARRDSVGTNPQRLRLNEPTAELYFSYTVDGSAWMSRTTARRAPSTVSSTAPAPSSTSPACARSRRATRSSTPPRARAAPRPRTAAGPST